MEDAHASVKSEPLGHPGRGDCRGLAGQHGCRGRRLWTDLGFIVIGLVGAFIGDWLLPQLGIHLGTGIVPLIVNAFIGALVLLLILRLATGWRGGWRRRWW